MHVCQRSSGAGAAEDGDFPPSLAIPPSSLYPFPPYTPPSLPPFLALCRVRAECDAKLAAAADDHKIAMERQLIELTGSAEELAALRDEKDKEGRVELLRRQVTRRIMNADISRGFTAWYELWSAKTHAMQRLKEVGNKLRAPGLYTAFSFWTHTCAAWGQGEGEDEGD